MGEYKQAITSSSVKKSARPLPLSRAAALPTISDEMVTAGVAVLWGSGAVEGRLGSDALLVAEIFLAMNGASSRSTRKAM